MDETTKMWKKRALRKQAGPVLRKWFIVSGPVKMSGYRLQCLVLKTSDREGVEIHNFDRGVSRRRHAQERGHLSLFSDKYRCRQMFLGSLKYLRAVQEMRCGPGLRFCPARAKSHRWRSDIPVEGYIPWGRSFWGRDYWVVSSTGSRHRQPGFFHDEFGIRWRVKGRPRTRHGVWLMHLNFGCYEVPR
jgi:hypothetical protein